VAIGLPHGHNEVLSSRPQAFAREHRGIAVWRTSSLKQRTAVFRTLFNSNKFAMSKASLGPCACAVPLGNIFSDTTPVHKKWQKFHQTGFEWTCELVFQKRFVPTSDDRRRLFGYGKGSFWVTNGTRSIKEVWMRSP